LHGAAPHTQTSPRTVPQLLPECPWAEIVPQARSPEAPLLPAFTAQAPGEGGRTGPSNQLALPSASIGLDDFQTGDDPIMLDVERGQCLIQSYSGVGNEGVEQTQVMAQVVSGKIL
jgi:hypothetical protein